MNGPKRRERARQWESERPTRYPALLTFRIFPPNWDWRRVSEFGVASYQACVGAVAFVHPASLSHSSYDALMAMMSPQQWGLSLWLVAMLHAIAIYTNGRSPFYSGVARTIACTLHLGVMLMIAIAYVQVGDFYRIVTTAFLIFNVLAAASMATEDVARLLNRRRL